MSRVLLRLTILVTVCTLALLPVSAVGAEAQRDVRVGMYENKPKVYTDEHGNPAGIFPDLLKEVALREDWNLVWVRGSWDDGLSALESGDIDLMPDVAYSRERDLRFDFHRTPVAESWSYVYARDGVDVEKISDLDGLRVAVLTNSIQETVFREMVEGFGYEVEFVGAPSLLEAFALARDGSADAALANHLFGQYYDAAYSLHQTPIVFSPSPLFFAAGSGQNGDLLGAIDEYLELWINQPDSPYHSTIERYTAMPEYWHASSWLYWALAGITSLLAVAAGWVLLLRWQVRLRTRELEAAAVATAAAEQTLRLAFDAAAEGIWDWDMTTGDIVWSDQCYTMLGYGVNEIPIHIDVFTELIHPDDVEAVMDRQRECLMLTKTNFSVEYRIRQKSGKYLWVRSTGKPVGFDASGETVRAVGTNTDITERRLAQLGLEEQRDQLEELVAERTSSLELANAEMEQKNIELAEATAAKSRFLANMSHELRTPMNSIIGFSGILASGKAGSLSPEQQFQMEMVNRSGLQLLELINGVLDIAKVESGHIEVILEEFDPATMLTEVAETLRPIAAGKGLSLTVDAGGAHRKINTDRAKLRQILVNLVGNAVKFTSAGSVHLRVNLDSDGRFVFDVTDTGSGIPSDELSAVFEPFNQASTVDGEVTEGTGLGLPISREFAQLLGGEVTVASTLGQGSTFTLTLPAR